MGEAKRRKVIQESAERNRVKPDLTKCSAGSVAIYCCVGDTWQAIKDTVEFGFYIYGEPLPPKVIEVAPLYGIDPHDLDYHVEGVHGWEPHDIGYDDRVLDSAVCMVDTGYLMTGDVDGCRSDVR